MMPAHRESMCSSRRRASEVRVARAWFDTAGGGSVGLNEFPALWTHLGGAPLQDASMDASGLSEDQMLAVLKKFFWKESWKRH